ncbi:MAG: NADPH-dependent assimilatory sulfite reductase hemoprotein subunit [Chloroflexaceae bacterium]|nr:NADPH-dependent assimilatory sulfite reductase hemoprotein subunit [Chloroflexaceae bacterium]
MTQQNTTDSTVLSKVERIKRESQGLMGELAAELHDPNRSHLSDEAIQVLKFHGSYQQDDRDERKVRQHNKRERAWQFMIRTRTAGGRLTAEQYLALDELASTYANDTLRITTRQGIQFHGVEKSSLKPLIRALNEHIVTTQAACGDVARNVMTCPVADLLPGDGTAFDYQALAAQVSDRLLPESTAYYELWLDGEKILADGTHIKIQQQRDESLYGPTYLPRKHKIGIGLPHDNCIDVYTHDLALEAVLEDGQLRGFNLLVGGGLGYTHNKPETFARLSDRAGFLPPEQALAVLETATTIYRDFGDRTNRRHARMKYIVADRGIAWFREELARRLGAPLADPVAVTQHDVCDHLGWQQQADGNWLVGIWIENGRVKDAVDQPTRSGIREIVQTVRPEVRLTAHHNIILTHIAPADKPRVEALIAQYGLVIDSAPISNLRRYAMACPALPTCGLAVAESERYLPALIGELEARGLGNEQIWIRMSGCPNSCSRPTTAEVGLVGRSMGLYQVYLGGSFAGTRLARLYRGEVREHDLADLLESLIVRWRTERLPNEAFGDWSDRVLGGAGELQAWGAPSSYIEA